MNRIQLISCAVAALALQGCAGMSEQECLVTDWYTVGFEDGARGASGDRIGQYRKACGDYGVAPDLDAYRAGREEGLREFCRPQNGFNVGASGGLYGGACPAEMEGDFLASYQAGRGLYELESEVHSVHHRLQGRSYELEAVNKELGATTAALTRPELTLDERIQLIAELNQLIERREALGAEIARLERQALASERRLARYRAELAYH